MGAYLFDVNQKPDCYPSSCCNQEKISDSPQFRFRFDRSLQATAYLLKKAKSHEMSYIHLLKILYISDREYLAEYGYMITGDRVVAMQYGPVLSQILNLIKAKGTQSQRWHHYIQTLPKMHKIRLINDPGISELSRASMKKLDSVYNRYGNLKPFEVVRLTHEFPEWQCNYQELTSTTIPWQAILQAQGEEKMIRIAKEQIELQVHQDAIEEVLQ